MNTTRVAPSAAHRTVRRCLVPVEATISAITRPTMIGARTKSRRKRMHGSLSLLSDVYQGDMSHLYRFLREDAADYVELGFTQFTLGVNGPDWTLGPEVEEWLEWRDEQRAARAFQSLRSGR